VSAFKKRQEKGYEVGVSEKDIYMPVKGGALG